MIYALNGQYIDRAITTMYVSIKVGVFASISQVQKL